MNLDKPSRWKADIAESVDLYNRWFLDFAPRTYIETRQKTTETVENALLETNDLLDVSSSVLREKPFLLPMLRMTTAPPIAKDRLIGLSQVPKSFVGSMEDASAPRIPPRLASCKVDDYLSRIGDTIERMADRELFPWIDETRSPTENERYRAASVVADRLTGALANPILRNAQESWQLGIVGRWLEQRSYELAPHGTRFDALRNGQFAFRMNASGKLDNGQLVSIPVDIVIKPHRARPRELPLLVEAKSAGDFTNVNKRRKEEANKLANLRRLHGTDVRFVLYLRGYFDASYLGYSASEGIDWVWEHRTDDLSKFGL